jgi:hypothetical protein
MVLTGGSISKSTVSCKFIDKTKEALAKILQRELNRERYLAIFICSGIRSESTGEKESFRTMGRGNRKCLCLQIFVNRFSRKGLYTDEGILVIINFGFSTRCPLFVGIRQTVVERMSMCRTKGNSASQ